MSLTILDLLDENFFEIFSFFDTREFLPIIFTCKKFKTLIFDQFENDHDNNDDDYDECAKKRRKIKKPKMKQIVETCNLFLWYQTNFIFRPLKQSFYYYLYTIKYTRNSHDKFEILNLLYNDETIELDVSIFNTAFLIGDIDILDWLFDREFPCSKFVLLNEINNVSFQWYLNKIKKIKSHAFWRDFLFQTAPEEKILKKYHYLKKLLNNSEIFESIKTEIFCIIIEYQLDNLVPIFLLQFDISNPATFFFLIQYIVMYNRKKYLISLLNFFFYGSSNKIGSHHINCINEILEMFKEDAFVVETETYQYLNHRYRI